MVLGIDSTFYLNSRLHPAARLVHNPMWVLPGENAPSCLVDMRRHDYHLEPNVHFSPDGRWIVFRGNFEGESQIYAVEVTVAPP